MEHVNINIYNIQGQLIETLVKDNKDIGNYNINWDASKYSSGMYFVQFITSNNIQNQKIMLLK